MNVLKQILLSCLVLAPFAIPSPHYWHVYVKHIANYICQPPSNIIFLCIKGFFF